MGEIVVISVGGSLIVPEQIDMKFLRAFKTLVQRQVKKGKRFAIIIGGGKTCRYYQQAANKITKQSQEELDWIGIRVTRLNAHLMKSIFGKLANKNIIDDPTVKLNFKEKVIIGAGWKPGCSSDHDAVLIAKNLKAKKVINLSNIDYVYTKDPNKYKDAKLIKEISWKDFRKLLPKKWTPGANVPFDPIAAKEAEKQKLEVTIMNGKNLKNLENYIEKKKFKGTKIN